MSNSRSKARAAALQGLYQWQLTGQDISSIDTEFIIDQNLINVDKAYFQKLLSGVIQHQRELDSCIEPFLDRPINEVNLVEYAILRIGAFEFLFVLIFPTE